MMPACRAHASASQRAKAPTELALRIASGVGIGKRHLRPDPSVDRGMRYSGQHADFWGLNDQLTEMIWDMRSLR
jgi:hypothetical protein